MANPDRRDLGRVFDEVPELYDRVRPTYPEDLFADLVAITSMDERSSVLEVGCGTGQATRSLAALGSSVTAVEPGAGMTELARQRLATFPNVEVETSSFEEWDDHGRRFDVLVAASAWHWVDPSVGWRRAHDVLHPGGWMALLGNVVVRRSGEPEVYAETADLHERFAPGNPDWGHPPLEEAIAAVDTEDVGTAPVKFIGEPAVATTEIKNALAGNVAEVPVEKLVEPVNLRLLGVLARNLVPCRQVISARGAHLPELAITTTTANPSSTARSLRRAGNP